MRKFVLILLLFPVFSFAQVTKTVLAKGNIYSWKIERMNDSGQQAIYFYFTALKGTNSNGFYIGIDSAEELKYFISELRIFASISDNLEHYQRYDSFILTLPENATKLVLWDCLGGYLYLSKTSAKSIATEIENKIYLMN